MTNDNSQVLRVEQDGSMHVGVHSIRNEYRMVAQGALDPQDIEPYGVFLTRPGGKVVPAVVRHIRSTPINDDDYSQVTYGVFMSKPVGIFNVVADEPVLTFSFHLDGRA